MYSCNRCEVKYAAFALGIMVAIEAEPGWEHRLPRYESNLSLRDRILSPLYLEYVASASRYPGRFYRPSLSGVDESGGRRWHYAYVSRQRLSTQIVRQQEPVGDHCPYRRL